MNHSPLPTSTASTIAAAAASPTIEIEDLRHEQFVEQKRAEMGVFLDRLRQNRLSLAKK